MSHRSVLPSIAWSFAFLHSIRENLMVTRRRDSPSAVWRPINSEYSPSPALLNALTLALYRELKCNPSTVQIVSRPQYTSWSNTPRLIRLDTSFSDASNFPLRRMIRIHSMHIYINVQSIENIEVPSKKSRFTLNSPPHPSSNSNKYPSMAGPLWPAHPTIPWPGGGCQATVTLLFSALHSSGINIGAPGAEGKKWAGREKLVKERKGEKKRNKGGSSSKAHLRRLSYIDWSIINRVLSREISVASHSFFLETKPSSCSKRSQTVRRYASETRFVDKSFLKLSREYPGTRSATKDFFFTEETKKTRTTCPL